MRNEMEDVGALDRCTYLGSSDCAAILGVSPWGTPLTVYKEKIGEGDQRTKDELDFFEFRKDHEDVIIKRLIRSYYAKIIYRNRRFKHPVYDFIAAEIDFEFEVTAEIIELCPSIPIELLGTIQNGECKSSHPLAGAKFGDEGTDEIPIEYAAQSMHGLGVTNRQICLYAVLCGDEFATYVLHRDQETIREITKKEVDFWHNHVLPRVPPEPINNEDLKVLFAKHKGRPVDLDDEAMKAYERLKYLRSAARSIEKEQDELKFQIGLHVARQWGLSAIEEAEDNAALNYAGAKVGSWNAQCRSSIDSKRLAKERPDIASEYMKTSHFRVIR